MYAAGLRPDFNLISISGLGARHKFASSTIKMRYTTFFSLTVAATVTCVAAQNTSADAFEQWHKPEAGHGKKTFSASLQTGEVVTNMQKCVDHAHSSTRLRTTAFSLELGNTLRRKISPMVSSAPSTLMPTSRPFSLSSPLARTRNLILPGSHSTI